MMPAPLFSFRLALSEFRSPFARHGACSKLRYLGGEKCVAEVCVLFVEVRGGS